MNLITTTTRLYLRKFTPDDAVHFFEMNNDPEVIKYTGDTAFDSIESAKEFLINYNQYELYGMGRWAVCLKDSGEFLGWCGLKYHPDKKLVEIGFRFYQKYWNKGYASESAKACLEYGFRILKLKEIFAHAHIENTASIHVIEKCRLNFVKTFDYDSIPANLYKIDNPYLSIKQITTLETYPVRHPVLREGRPLEDCKFAHDDDPTTFHLGLFIEQELIGVATFLKNDSELLQGNQYQLRGMGVLKNYQKKGLGNLIVKRGEEIIKSKQGNILWCNAREVAVNFYKKNGYAIIGTPFVIPKIGLHYIMYKHL